MNTNFTKNSYLHSALLIILLLLIQASTMAQSINGRIFSKDEDEALTFVTVAISGTSTGTISDIDGRFELKLPSGYQGEIVFQHVGYIRKKMTVAEIKNVSNYLFREGGH